MLLSRFIRKKQEQKTQQAAIDANTFQPAAPPDSTANEGYSSSSGGGGGGRNNSVSASPIEQRLKSIQTILNEYLKQRDYSAALSFLTFHHSNSLHSSIATASSGNSGASATSGPQILPTLNASPQQEPKQSTQQRELNRHYLQQIAYIHFRNGYYRKALDVLQQILDENAANETIDPLLYLSMAICNFYLGQYQEAVDIIESAKDSFSATSSSMESKLRNRLMFHLYHKLGDDKQLMTYHRQLQDIPEDHMTLASIHYLRGHYQEAIDVYKRLLAESRDTTALNVYVAMCYYKLDYFEVSQEVLSAYIQKDPGSFVATNLKACNYYRLYNARQAELELKAFQEKASTQFHYGVDLLNHNMVVFREGEGALQVLPKLLQVLPEAKLNLTLYHLKQNDIDSAFTLVQDLTPVQPIEFIIKAATYNQLHQRYGDYGDTMMALSTPLAMQADEYLKLAKEYFHHVGSMPAECDTIPGRQSMASFYFLDNSFSDVLVYFNSIKPFCSSDDVFNYNYGQALAMVGKYDEAEIALLSVQSERLSSEFTYLAFLARCFIMNGKAALAWELYLKLETSSESYQILNMIANDAYEKGAYVVAAKAFESLDRMDPSQAQDDAKYGACVGGFQEFFRVFQKGGIWDQRMLEGMRDILGILRRGEGDINNVSTINSMLGDVVVGRCGRLADTIEAWMHRRGLVINN